MTDLRIEKLRQLSRELQARDESTQATLSDQHLSIQGIKTWAAGISSDIDTLKTGGKNLTDSVNSLLSGGKTLADTVNQIEAQLAGLIAALHKKGII